MKIIQFVKGLLPHFEKSKVIEDLRITIGELDSIVLDNYSQASDHFRTNKIKSDKNKDLSDAFYQNFDLQRGSKQPSFVADVNKRMIFIKKNAEYILESVEALFERDIIAEGLTVRKALLLRAAESVSFVSRFSIDLLNLVYVNEAIEVNGLVEESLQLPPVTVKLVNNNITKFAKLISDYGLPNEDFKKLIQELPEIVINSKTANSVIGLYNEKDIDPFSNSYVVGFTGNPIYHIRLMVAEWQASRYKANKDKKKMLELRLLHLRLLQDKKNDPKLEQEINYIQSRIDKIGRYLNEVEESIEQTD
jgi:hypothetical protein